MGIHEIISSLGDNPYFGAGFGLFGIGAVTAIARRGATFAGIILKRHYMTSLEIPCRDKSYFWVMNWITVKGARKTQHLCIDTKFDESSSGKVSTKHDFVPSVGDHFFWYKGAWIKVERVRAQQTIDLQLGIPFETITLSTYGNRKTLFKEIVDDARELAMAETAGKTLVYTAVGPDWRTFGHPRKPRPLNSVVLANGIADRIVSDVENFITDPQWYTTRGIPYRRGYLLHGPPGCGKSSFITALAGELQLGICILNLSDRGLTDDRLSHLLANAPENSIILLEDVDAAFITREESEQTQAAYSGLSRLTFSGFLNSLDGVASSEGRILFMTTNYPQRLDPALIRPGRVDIKEYIGFCDDSQLKEMFRRFYPEAPAEFCNQFSKAAESTGISLSPAMIQGYFMEHKESFSDAIQNIRNLSNDGIAKTN